LARNAKLRRKIVPAPAERATETSSENAHAQGAPARMSWARLLKRVFDIDIEHCPNCGGHLKIIAAIEDPPVISSAIWACPPAPHRAHQRSDSIYSKRPEKTKLLANASRRRPLALSSSGAGAIRNKSRPSRPPLRPSRLVQLRVFYITPVIEKGGLKILSCRLRPEDRSLRPRRESKPGMLVQSNVRIAMR